jgi:hypothetical protein
MSGEAPKAASSKYRLRISALNPTWIKVIVDGKHTKEYRLNAGDEIRLEAASGYNLLIGDAGSVQMTLNDSPIAVPGKSGQVVTLHLPHGP